MNDPLVIDNQRVIGARHISMEVMRSGGPGGQHANKTDTAVRLRFDVSRCGDISARVKEAIIRQHPGKMTAEGELLLVSSRHRARQRNIQEVRERLRTIILAASARRKPRRPTRPTRGSQKRRVAAKRQRSELKRTRGKVRRGEE